MSGMPLFVGVDGGASKTLAVAVDATGREVGRGAGPASNQTAVGLTRAVEAVREAVGTALRAAGEVQTPAAAWIGLAGIDRPGDRETFGAHLGPLAGEIRLTNDGELVLTGLPDAVGVAAIAGTGTIFIGRDASGRTVRTGGWGHVFGDEGSGYDLGRRALQVASRAADGRGPATALLPALLDHWGLRDASEIIPRVYHGQGSEKAEIARLAGLVFTAARAGDGVARRLMSDAAAELALGITTIAAILDLPEGRLPLALAGGLLVGVPELRRATVRRVRRRWHVEPLAIVDDPALSAARAAIRLAEAAR